MFTCLEKWQAQSYCSRSWIPLQCQAVEIIICSHQMQEKLNYLQAKVAIAALSSTTCFPRQFWVQISAGSRRHQDFRWIAMTVHIHIHTGIHSMIFIYGLIHSFIITHIARSHGPTETTQGILSPTSKALSSPKLAGSSRSSLESKNLHWATVSALKNPNECGEMGDGGSYFLLVKWGHLFKKMKKNVTHMLCGQGTQPWAKKN